MGYNQRSANLCALPRETPNVINDYFCGNDGKEEDNPVQ
jgi:hypothetical protein